MVVSDRSVFLVRATAAISLLLAVASCSSAKKTTPELSKLGDQKIALVEIDGQDSARRVVEVAIINELTRRGTFIIVPKEAVLAARSRPDTDTTDWRGIAKAAGAQAALRIKVIQFEANLESGYSKDIVPDSELEAEQGKKGSKAERYYKVKRLTGQVAFDVQFALGVDQPKGGELRSAIAKAEGSEEQEEKLAAARLTPRLRFLETISQKAIQQFFDRYSD